jgi:hypothetical protein
LFGAGRGEAQTVASANPETFTKAFDVKSDLLHGRALQRSGLEQHESRSEQLIFDRIHYKFNGHDEFHGPERDEQGAVLSRAADVTT